VRATQLGFAIPALQKEAATIEVRPGWSRAEVLQAAYVRAHLGQTDEAMSLLQATVRREFEAREPMNPALSNAMFAARQYQIALGLIGDAEVLGPFGTTGSGIEELKPLFPLKADAWPGAGAWVAAVTREVPQWIAQGVANRDSGIQVLSLAALRLHQMGDVEGAKAASLSLAAVLRMGTVSIKASTLAMSVADTVGAPVDLRLLQDLVRANRLHISRVQAVIARTAIESADAALRLGAEAARFTSDEGLIAQLVSIAQKAGSASEAQRWSTRQQEASAARAQLKKAASSK